MTTRKTLFLNAIRLLQVSPDDCRRRRLDADDVEPREISEVSLFAGSVNFVTLLCIELKKTLHMLYDDLHR